MSLDEEIEYEVLLNDQLFHVPARIMLQMSFFQTIIEGDSSVRQIDISARVASDVFQHIVMFLDLSDQGGHGPEQWPILFDRWYNGHITDLKSRCSSEAWQWYKDVPSRAFIDIITAAHYLGAHQVKYALFEMIALMCANVHGVLHVTEPWRAVLAQHGLHVLVESVTTKRQKTASGASASSASASSASNTSSASVSSKSASSMYRSRGMHAMPALRALVMKRKLHKAVPLATVLEPTTDHGRADALRDIMCCENLTIVKEFLHCISPTFEDAHDLRRFSNVPDGTAFDKTEAEYMRRLHYWFQLLVLPLAAQWSRSNRTLEQSDSVLWHMIGASFDDAVLGCAILGQPRALLHQNYIGVMSRNSIAHETGVLDRMAWTATLQLNGALAPYGDDTGQPNAYARYIVDLETRTPRAKAITFVLACLHNQLSLLSPSTAMSAATPYAACMSVGRLVISHVRLPVARLTGSGHAVVRLTDLTTGTELRRMSVFETNEGLRVGSTASVGHDWFVKHWYPVLAQWPGQIKEMWPEWQIDCPGFAKLSQNKFPVKCYQPT